MSLDKAIQHGKEHRKPYRGAKAIDPWCRNHGGDDWSKSDYTIQRQRAEQAADAKLNEDNTYGCDKCGGRFDWDTEIIWITSSYGVCKECHNKMSVEEKNAIRLANGDEPIY